VVPVKITGFWNGTPCSLVASLVGPTASVSKVGYPENGRIRFL
jgi:hypothetical protein